VAESGCGRQQAIEQAISNSDTAWLTGDCREFAKWWRFEFQPNVPTKQGWFDLINKHAGLWRRWESSITEMQNWRGVAVQVAQTVFVMQSSKDPEKPDYNTLWIRAAYTADWADNAEVWEGSRLLSRSHGTKYKIVHWEFPLEEMKAAHAGKCSG